MHLFQRIVNILYLLLPLQLPLLRLQLIQFLEQRLDLSYSFLAELPNVRPLLQQRDEVPPYYVRADRDQAEDLAVRAGLVDEVEGLSPGNVLEELLGQRDDHSFVILEKLNINVHLLLFFVVEGLDLGALRLEYSAMGVGGAWSIVH